MPAPRRQRRFAVAWRYRLHLGARPAFPAQAGQGWGRAVRQCPAPPGTARRKAGAHWLGWFDGGGGVKLSFDDSVEEFRAEFLAWLADNRPSTEEMAADPAKSTAHLPAW